jgi:hypothetical protein
MTEERVVNPYRHLASQSRALLRMENNLGPDERSKLSWMLRVEFAGTSVVVGKGGANTMFAQFGNGRRVVNYPNKILARLDRLGRQEHVLYGIYRPDRSWTQFWLMSKALEEPAVVGSRIYGVSANGTKTVTHDARRSVRGGVTWIRRGRK